MISALHETTCPVFPIFQWVQGVSNVTTLIRMQIMPVVADITARDSTLKEWVLHLDMGQQKPFGEGGLTSAIKMAYQFMAAE